MKKAISLLTGILAFGLVFFGTSYPVKAGPIQCPSPTFSPNPPTTAGFSITFSIPQQLVQTGNSYEIRRRNMESASGVGWDSGAGHTQLSEATVFRNFTGDFAPGDSFEFMVVVNGTDYCNYKSGPIYGPQGAPTCTASLISIPSGTVVGQQVSVTIRPPFGLSGFNPGSYPINLNGENICTAVIGSGGISNCRTHTVTFFQPENTLTVANYANSSETYCALSITVPTEAGGEVIVGPTDPDEVPLQASRYQLCEQINDPVAKSNCELCYGKTPRGVWTAVGCITATSSGIVRELLTIGLSLAGGVAILLVLASGFLFSTSQGDPKRTGEAKELLTSAVIGLLFIIFGVTILQFIGVTLFRLPGFGT